MERSGKVPLEGMMEGVFSTIAEIMGLKAAGAVAAVSVVVAAAALAATAAAEEGDDDDDEAVRTAAAAAVDEGPAAAEALKNLRDNANTFFPPR